jgi:hypothetical protein
MADVPDTGGVVGYPNPETLIEPKPKTSPATGSSGPTQGGTGIMNVRSVDELRKIAEGQVGAEIEGQIAPLSASMGTLGAREERAVTDIGAMFGTILPFSQGAAERVGTAYDTAEGQQQAIMQAATKRMNELAQGRAQEAQALAQEMGGPVALNEFTSSMGVEPMALSALGAGQQLKTLQYGLADVGEANAFAGRVLPLVQTEETAKARSYYEDQIQELRKQIDTIKGTKTGKVNAAVNDLLVKERTFQLEQNQQALDKLKVEHDWASTKATIKNAADRLRLDKLTSYRDWQATLKTLKQEAKKIGITEREWKLREAEVTGKYGGKPTIEAKKLTADQEAARIAAGLSKKQYLEQIRQFNVTAKQSARKFALAEKATWAQWLDTAISPEPGKPVTIMEPVVVPNQLVLTGKVKDAVPVPKLDKNGKPIKGTIDHYERLRTRTFTPTNTPITDPNDLVDYLKSHNVPSAVAERMVKARLQIPNWEYGLPDPNAHRPGTPGFENPGRTTPGE